MGFYQERPIDAKAILRRAQIDQLSRFDPNRAISYGTFSLDPVSRVAQKDSELVALTPAQQHTLEVTHGREWMSYQEIASAIDQHRAHDGKSHGSVSPNHVPGWITDLEQSLGIKYERDGKNVRLHNPQALDQDQ